jgi:hypothetical protein
MLELGLCFLALLALESSIEVFIVSECIVFLFPNFNDVLFIDVGLLSEYVASKPLFRLLHGLQCFHEPLLQLFLLASQLLLQAKLPLLPSGELIEFCLHNLVLAQVLFIVCQLVELRLVEAEPPQHIRLYGQVAVVPVAVDLALISDSPVDALVFILLLWLFPSHELPWRLVCSEIGIVLEHVQVALFQFLLGDLPALALDNFRELIVVLSLLIVLQLLVLGTPQHESP